ncbi:unnamed protein product [Closterium sp. NIES-64]|nr:unnamed protein product [Closterium sp. NIES-64]
MQDDSGIGNGVVGIQGSDGPEGVFGPAATQNRSSDADHGVLDCSQQMLYGCGCAVVFLMSQVWVWVCCGVSHKSARYGYRCAVVFLMSQVWEWVCCNSFRGGIP